MDEQWPRMKAVETYWLLFLGHLQPSTHMSNNIFSSEQKRLRTHWSLHLTDLSGCIPLPWKVNYSTRTRWQEEVCETWHMPWSDGRFSCQFAAPEVNRDQSQPGRRSFWGFGVFLIAILFSHFRRLPQGGKKILVLYLEGSREYWIFFGKFEILWVEPLDNFIM